MTQDVKPSGLGACAIAQLPVAPHFLLRRPAAGSTRKQMLRRTPHVWTISSLAIAADPVPAVPVTVDAKKAYVALLPAAEG